jgi:hypothetical protein
MNTALFGPQNKTGLLLQLHTPEPYTLIDTTGEAARAFANRATITKSLYFDPSDTARPVGLNVLDRIADPVQTAEQITEYFFQLFPAGANTLTRENTQFLLDNSLRLLLAQDSPQTLLSVLKLLSDTSFRQDVLNGFMNPDPVVLDNWRTIEALDGKTKQALFFSLRTKLGRVLNDPLVRNIVGQPYNTFPEGVNIIANLDRAKIGNLRAKFLGGLLMARSTGHVVITDYGFFGLPIPLEQNRFTIGLNFLDELTPQLRQAVLNIPEKYVFNTNRKDAEALSFYVDAPNPSSLMGNATTYRYIDGRDYRPDPPPSLKRLTPLKKRTRACHTAARAQVERDIKRFLE